MSHLLGRLWGGALRVALAALVAVGPVASAPLNVGPGRALLAAKAVAVVAAPTLVAGASGIWHLDQMDDTTKAIPNAASATPYDGNLLRAPARNFSNTSFWDGNNIGVSSDGTVSFADGSSDASTIAFSPASAFTGIGPAFSASLPAGTYTIAAWVKHASSTASLSFFGIPTVGRVSTVTLDGVGSQSFVATTNWKLATYTFTASSAFDPSALRLGPVDSSTTATISLGRFGLFSGNAAANATALSTTTPWPLAGHLTLGAVSTDSRVTGKLSAAQLDMSTSGATGLVQFAAHQTGGQFTFQVLAKKVGTAVNLQTVASRLAGGSGYSSWASTITTVDSGKTYLSARTYDFTGSPTVLFDRYAEGGYHVLTWRYNGTRHTLWFDDICVAYDNNGNSLSGVTNFHQMIFNGLLPFNYTSQEKYAGSIVFYPTALSDANLAANVDALHARAQGAGVTTSPISRFVFVDGDSRSAGSVTAGQWPALYSANKPAGSMGVVLAVNGSQLAANLQVRLNALPTSRKRAGLRVAYLMGPMGANDLTNAGYDAATYYGQMKTALDMAQSKFATDILLSTEMTTSGAAAGHDSRKNTLNGLYRASFPLTSGTGTLIDLQASAQAALLDTDTSLNDNYVSVSSGASTVTSGSDLITVPDTTKMRNGMLVFGASGAAVPGFTAEPNLALGGTYSSGTYVTQIVSGTQIRVNRNATVSGTPALQVGYWSDNVLGYHMNISGDALEEPIYRTPLNAALAP